MVGGLLSGIDEFLVPTSVPEGAPYDAETLRMARATLLANLGATLLSAGQGGQSYDQRAQTLGGIGKGVDAYNQMLQGDPDRKLKQLQLQSGKQGLEKGALEIEAARRAMAQQEAWRNYLQQGLTPSATTQVAAQAAGVPVAPPAAAGSVTAPPAIPSGPAAGGALSSPTPAATPAATAAAPAAGGQGAGTWWGNLGLNEAQTRQILAHPNRDEIIKQLTLDRAKGPQSREERAQQIIVSAARNPAIAETPEYAVAFDSLYGPKMVQGFNPQSQQMEYVWVQQPLPPGVPQPVRRDVAAPAAAGALLQQPLQPGGVAPVAARPPIEEKAGTEEENKAAAFARRMIGAKKILNPLDQTDASRPGAAELLLGNRVGERFAGFLRSGDRQRYEQAQRDWVTANLRKESGAVIGVDEMQQEIFKYFPQPGDTPQTIEQKRISREAATQGMIAAAGRQAQRQGLKYEPYEAPMEDRIRAMSGEQALELAEQAQANPNLLDAKQRVILLRRIQQLNRGR